jgi:uncharacterized OB-fold protein
MAAQENKIIYQEAACYGMPAGGKPHLIGSRCAQCGYVAFPPRPACSACIANGTMEKITLGSIGTLANYSVLHTGTPEFKAPYVFGYVLIGGAKVMSLIAGCEAKEGAVEIGEEVELVIEKLREDEQGNEIHGYKFRPTGRTSGKVA